MSNKDTTGDSRRRLHYFTTDRTHLPLPELLDAVAPFGITLTGCRSRVSAWMDDDGEMWVDIGFIYRWKDGRIVARYRKGASEAMQRALVEAASRAAVEKDFVKRSWRKLRPTKTRQAGEYMSMVVACNPGAEVGDRLRRALTFASDRPVSEVDHRIEVADAARTDRNEVQA